jgi:transcriptional regulator with XRE-family HTH domain
MNWEETIRLLKEAGFKQADIAAQCGCSQAAISELSTGETKEPRYSLGLKLRALATKAKRRLAKAAA